MPTKLRFESYLDKDGDLFVWIQDNEGYRWYPLGNWPKGTQGVNALHSHILGKITITGMNSERLRGLLEISFLGDTPESKGLKKEEVYATLEDLGHVGDGG